MLTKNKVLISSLLVLFLLGGQALAQVTIKKEVPPPLELNIEDCVSATIQSSSSMIVYIVGTVTEATKGLIAKVTTEKFEINPGINHYDAAHLPPIAETWIASEYEGVIKRTGRFPEGNFTLLIQLFTEAGELLDDDQRRQEVKYPQINLLSPEDGAEITGPFPVFQWMSRRAILNLVFVLAIYKMMQGQTPQEAIEAGIPYFEQKDIKTTSFSYPVGAEPLEPGQRYCWQVTALIDGYPTATSEIWLFNFGGAVQIERCKYYLDEDGRMWHSLGGGGKIGVRHDSCKYVLTIKGMFHSDGERWNSVEVDSCDCILAINGMFHFNGKRWVELSKVRCRYAYVKPKKQMFHCDGEKWTPIEAKKCTYISAYNGMFHFNGEGWEKVLGEECRYLKAENGMFHFKDNKWEKVSGRRCYCLKAENGMFHYDGKDWTPVPEEKCTYALTKGGMLHYNGEKWELKMFEKCTYIKAYNGMFHSRGENKWKEVRGKKCECLLAENGMFHYNGAVWIKVPDKECTYALTKKGMYHYDGKEWKLKTFEKCTYIKAYNGMFHFDGRKWVRGKPRKCTYILTYDGKMYHADGEKWELVPGYYCQWVQAVNGWYHYHRGKWNPPQECNYRVEVIRVGRSTIKARIYHYENGRWVQVVSKDIPIGKPERCPACTYYFERIAPDEFVVYHCIERDRPEEITRVKIPRGE